MPEASQTVLKGAAVCVLGSMLHFTGGAMLQPNLPLLPKACCQQTAQHSLAGASRKE